MDTKLNERIEKKAAAFAEDFLTKLAEFTGQDLETTSNQPENVAVDAEEETQGLEVKENKMEELKACDTATASEEEVNLEANAAKDAKPEGVAPEQDLDLGKKETDPKTEEKPADKKPGEGKGQDFTADMKIIKECDPSCQSAMDKVENALKDLQAAAEECGNPECKKAAEKIVKAFDIKADKPQLDLGADMAEGKLPAEPLGDAKAPEEELMPKGGANPLEEAKACYANLVATLDKRASVGDSVWVIKDAAQGQEFASFNIKAAFGDHINQDAERAAYAQSEEFGKAVVASLAANKVHDVLSTTAAVLQVVAHYSPTWAGAQKFKDNPQSSHKKASGEGDVETDKNLIGGGAKEAKAGYAQHLGKKAEYNVPAATDNGEIASDSALLDGADKRTEKVNNNTEKSATPANSTKVETETDRKLVAAYEAQLKRQAAEIEALHKQAEAMKTEAAIKEKSAKVKECVALMCNKGFIKADESVRVASLKDGLSIEAANGRAMAASIDKQAKYLFGMNSTQLDAYMNSLKGVATPSMTTSASANSVLNIKASASSENETDRLLKVLGWD